MATEYVPNNGSQKPAGFAPAAASVSLKIQLNENLYLRDPQESKLGKSIITQSILLLDELGLEDFTFKKLAVRMESTEASVYRYFANKHLLLVYLSSYYWAWIRYRIEVENHNISDPTLRLENILVILVDAARHQPDNDFVDMSALHRIVVSESAKVYYTKLVDEENRQGFFLMYKALCWQIAEVLLAIAPNYPYPRALASSLMEMAKDHIYFALHLPRLTDITIHEGDFRPAVELLRHFTFTQLRGSLPTR
jgi:AcrR family transcriptional regulator